jgi:hypothetical protein
MAGTYNICIDGTDGQMDYEEYCFEVVITQPDVLFVGSKTSYDDELTVVSLQGSDVYFIELNGEVSQTTASEISLDLKKGNNTLKVYTNLACQGIYEESIFLGEEPIIYPNPFVSSVTVYFNTNVEKVRVRIFTTEGRLVLNEAFEVYGMKLPLDLSILSSGLYIVKFESEQLKGTTKIIKQ